MATNAGRCPRLVPEATDWSALAVGAAPAHERLPPRLRACAVSVLGAGL